MRRLPLFALLWAASALAAPSPFKVDSGRSELLAFTAPAGVLKGASHPHVIRAKEVSGEIRFDAKDIGSSSISVTVPVSSLVVDEPKLREREKMKPLSDGDRAKIDASMRSEKQLDEKRFPKISFTSSKVEAAGEGKLNVTGTLELHGAKKKLTVPVSYTLENGVFRGEGTVKFNHRDVGMTPFSAALGAIKNAEALELKLKLVGSQNR